jgi:hypothetical protein
VTPAAAREALRRLVDDYRDRCLWFIREDYYPSTEAEVGRILALVERHGDVAACRRVSEIRACLSPLFSD